MNTQLIDFYRGTGADAAGRTIDQIWAFDHNQLEKVHDYIQWLFPLSTASRYNPQAPLLDPETIKVFTEDADLKARLLKSLHLMLDFYGLALSTSSTNRPQIDKAVNYAARKSNWQDALPGFLNHNLLRLSRILEALSVLGCPDYSAALFNCLQSVQTEEPFKIPTQTLKFWQRATGAQ
jgi:hypothetical protein